MLTIAVEMEKEEREKNKQAKPLPSYYYSFLELLLFSKLKIGKKKYFWLISKLKIIIKHKQYGENKE